MRSACSAVLLAVLFACADSASAKRAAPKPVSAVAYKGITYSALNQGGRANYVIASDSTGKEQFRIKVFDTPIDPKLEEDVQWVFINELKVSGDFLLVKDEKGRCFAINLTTRGVNREYRCLF
jgi:hypothetical protein